MTATWPGYKNWWAALKFITLFALVCTICTCNVLYVLTCVIYMYMPHMYLWVLVNVICFNKCSFLIRFKINFIFIPHHLGGRDQVATKSQSSRNQVATKSQSSRNQVAIKSQPSRNQVATKSQPSRDPSRALSRPMSAWNSNRPSRL
jgi:hypothetical protein